MCSMASLSRTDAKACVERLPRFLALVFELPVYFAFFIIIHPFDRVFITKNLFEHIICGNKIDPRTSECRSHFSPKHAKTQKLLIYAIFECKYMKHIFELRMKGQIEERSSQLLRNLSGYITNSQYDQLPVGLIAQLVEHCTGIAEVMGSNPVQA